MRSSSRRGLLLASGGALLLAGCGSTGGGDEGRLRPGAVVRSAYGAQPDQFGYLSLPEREHPRATVVLIHGGGWQRPYDYRQMDLMAAALVELGAAVWTIEYRRLGGGGGWPMTFEDVAAAVDHLAVLPERHRSDGLELTAKVALVGHSAGGQLAVWAASRSARTPGGAPRVRPRGVVSLNGALDLRSLAQDQQLGEPVRRLLGGSHAEVPKHFRYGDPTLMVPASAPVWAVRARDDELVPAAQSKRYVVAAERAGGTATLVPVPGDHVSVIDPRSSSWTAIRRCIAQATTGLASPRP